MRGTFRNFGRDRSGNVAIMVAVCLTGIFGAMALSIDLGKTFLDRRTAQSVTDLAALTAAGNLAKAHELATDTIRLNNIPLKQTLGVQTGIYNADVGTAAGSRFTPAPANVANAVRIDLDTASKVHFARVIGIAGELPIRTTATAASTALASFSIGSRLASLNEGILNQLLGNALGAQLSLNAMDYRSLADLKVDIFGFLNAVAEEARITGPTYSSILTADVPAGDVLDGLSTVAVGDPHASAVALRALSLVARSAGPHTKIKLVEQIDLGPYKSLPRTEHPAAEILMSALDLLTTTARLADGKNQSGAEVGLTIPGLAGAQVQVTVGEKPVSSGWAATGHPSTTVETAQTRILVRVKLPPLGLAPLVNLPVYVDIAKSRATLSKLACATPTKGASVTLAVTPGVVDAWIANIPEATWKSMSPVVAPPSVAIADLGLLKVVAKAHARMGNMETEEVSFTKVDIAAGKIKTVKTRDYLNSLTASLLGDLQLGVGIGGIGLMLPTQQQALMSSLAAATAPIESVLFSVLTYLGIGLGEADVKVDGIRCDVAVLVD